MRKRNLIAGLVVLMIASGLSINAQQQRMRQNKKMSYQKTSAQSSCLSDLSAEQQEQMEALRIKHLKTNQSNLNMLNELQARKVTLQSADEVDRKELNKCIENISGIKVDMQKRRIRHMQEVKMVLDDAQLLAFENKHRMNNGKGRGNRNFCDGQGSSSKGYAKGHGRRGNGQGRSGHRGNGQGKGYEKAGFTDDQITIMQTSRLELMKKEQPLLNELNELRAALKTQTSGRDIDYKKVDKLIDEQADLQLKMAMLKMDHQLEIRQQLSDEQRLMWDMRRIKGKGHRRYMSAL
ncbi:hypothetical protein [Carboxylicivirga sp. N1Y90]|uniref:hypothetical protein n=1 Tax=Carboxylicivirga fragile TaxID=3417571 RepID=UPI003D354F61|nr:periplasmic heavy metal sensor [Marinilabiliaceae bacterium N1Y90]